MILLYSLHHRDSSRLAILRMTPLLMSFRGASRRGIPMMKLLNSNHHRDSSLASLTQNDIGESVILSRSKAQAKNPYDETF